MTNSNIVNAIKEIEAVKLDHPSEWLYILKESAIDAVHVNDAIMLVDNVDYCEMTAAEHLDFVYAIKNEMFFHDRWDWLNLERRIVRLSKDYVNAYNEIINILIKYGVGRVSEKWLMEATDSDELINGFCEYTLPSDAVVGGSWDLPDWYIYGNDDPDAPYWRFDYNEFSGYIKSVTATDNPGRVEVEYYLYKRDSAHCSDYYGLWTTGKAMVDINTHRRWNVE